MSGRFIDKTEEIEMAKEADLIKDSTIGEKNITAKILKEVRKRRENNEAM